MAQSLPHKAKTSKKSKAQVKHSKAHSDDPTSHETKETTPSPWKLRTRRYVKVTGRFVLRSSVPEILLVCSLVIARYLPNSDFSYPREVLLPVVLLGVVASLFYYFYRWILRTPLAAHAATLPMAYGLYAYSYAYSWLKGVVDFFVPHGATPFTTALITIVVWGVIFGIAAFALQQIISRVRQLQELPLLKIIVFVVCFIFAFQLMKFVQRVWTIRHQLAYTQSAVQFPQDVSRAAKDKPNMYYLVFDRYASNETLAKQYDYDNSAMTEFLTDQGFVNRDQAYANYPFTSQSVSSTLSMDYLTDLERFRNDSKGFQTGFAYRSILDNSPVTQILKQNGYTYNQLSSWWDFTRNNPTADNEPTRSFRLRVLGAQFWLSDLQRDIVNKSVLSPMLLKGISIGQKAVIKYDRDYNPRENFETQMAALSNIANDAAKPGRSKPQFTFAHILSPHDPYVFTETGQKPTYNGDRTDWDLDETEKYTKQLTYINSRFKVMIRELRQKDPTAVIIVQSDEGPYPKQFRGALSSKHYYDPINLPLAEMRQKFGIIASYYFPGVEDDVTKQQMTSSVNTFRFVLNRYLGYQFKPLPDCQFSAGNKFSMYNFEHVSGVLRGTTNPEACARYHEAARE